MIRVGVVDAVGSEPETVYVIIKKVYHAPDTLMSLPANRDRSGALLWDQTEWLYNLGG